MKNFNLTHLDVTSLHDDENMKINGGTIDNPDCIICYTVIVAQALADAAESFWNGLVAGFNGGFRSGSKPTF